MSTIRRIARNIGFLLLGDTLSALLGILLVIFLARELGVAEYGKYIFAVAFTSLFLILADLGLNVLTIREIARDNRRANDYFTTISVTKLGLSVVMLGLVAIVVNLLDYPADTVTVVYIIGLMNVLGNFGLFCRSIFRAFEKMEYDALTRVVERLLVVGSALVVLFMGNGLEEVVLAMLLAQTLSLVFTLTICLRRFVKPKLLFDFSLAKRLLRTSFPFAIAAIFATVILQTDSLMLSIMKGDEVVGWYGAAYRPIMGTLFLSAVFIGAIFPVLSRYFVTARENLVIAYEKSFKFLATLALPLGIGTMVIAERLIYFLYGGEYANSIIILQILAWSASLVFVITLLGHTLAAIDKQVVDMRITGSCALLNVVLNLILIPNFSYIGAAVASVTTQAIVLGWEFGYLQKHLSRLRPLKMLYKQLAAALVMGGIIYILNGLLDDGSINLFIIIIAGIVSYVLMLLLFKAFNKEELEIIKRAFKRQDDRHVTGRGG